MDEWILQLEAALYKLADGDVSDADAEFIMDNIPKVGDELKAQLQALVDDPKEQRNIQYALAAIGMVKLAMLARG